MNAQTENLKYCYYCERDVVARWGLCTRCGAKTKLEWL